jgi:hypothetical protein
MLEKKFQHQEKPKKCFLMSKDEGKKNSHQKVVKGFLRLVSKNQR